MTRRLRTPRERAEEALAVADRKVARLSAERDKLQGTLSEITQARAEAVRRRDYLAQDPALSDEPPQEEVPE